MPCGMELTERALLRRTQRLCRTLYNPPMSAEGMTSNEVKCKQAQSRKRPVIRELEKVWLSPAEAKAYLDCSDEFLERLRSTSEIAFARISNRYYYEAASICRMFERHRVVAVKDA